MGVLKVGHHLALTFIVTLFRLALYVMTTYLGNTLVLASSILTHFLSFCMRFCSFMALGCVKSKSAVNWVFIFWKTGSCTVACARLARLSDAAEENAPLTELETTSVDIQNGVLL